MNTNFHAELYFYIDVYYDSTVKTRLDQDILFMRYECRGYIIESLCLLT